MRFKVLMANIIVLFLGFGPVLICWLMPMFRRNVLSPSSRAEVTRQGNI
jgi:hypothetical protein